MYYLFIFFKGAHWAAVKQEVCSFTMRIKDGQTSVRLTRQTCVVEMT
jgi:hypothetical protein